jgi:serine/threonine protein phosphatase PrpC
VEEQSPAHPEWRAHLQSQHPVNESNTLVMRNRIFGLIAVGGSFGDCMYKVPFEYQIKVLPFLPYDIYRTFSRYHHHIINHYRTPPYLESKPLVTRHELHKDDRFIILGTDGLWDELSWDNVRSTDGDQIAALMMGTWKSKGESNPATHLLREALLYQAVYKNIGIKERVEDESFELSKRLTRQPSRNYRDDITITVLELEGEPVFENVGPVNETSEVDVNAPYLVDPTKKSTWFSGWVGSRM